MRVLVTGGAGYIGSVLVPMLLQQGHEVAVLDNFLFGQTPLLDVVHDPKLEVIRGDARDERTLRDALRGADFVFPLACLTGAPLCAKDPVGAQTVIVDAIATLLRLRSPSQGVIYPTTNSGYGVGEKDAYCTEESPLRPVSLYGRVKVEAEQRILDAGHSTTLRLATAFGVSPRMRLDLLVNDFVHRAVTDRFVVLFEAHFRRNFVHVRDISRGFLHAMERFDAMKGGPYNLGLDEANMSKAGLCEAIAKHVPGFVWYEAQVGEDPDKRDYVVSSEKLHRTGWKPEVSLDDGIRELVKGYQILRRNQFSNV